MRTFQWVFVQLECAVTLVREQEVLNIFISDDFVRPVLSIFIDLKRLALDHPVPKLTGILSALAILTTILSTDILSWIQLHCNHLQQQDYAGTVNASNTL